MQITVLRVFNQILNDPMIEHDLRYKEMRSFAAHIVRHFITDLQKKPHVKGIEVLFWRHKGECISNGSGVRNEDEGPDQADEDADFDLAAELKHAAESRAAEQTKKRVTKKTVRTVPRVSTHQPQSREWREEEVEELRDTYARYSSGPDCLDVIVNLMHDVTVCQCFHKLQELGLIDAAQRCPESSDAEVEETEEIEVEVSEEEPEQREREEGRSIFRKSVERAPTNKQSRRRDSDANDTDNIDVTNDEADNHDANNDEASDSHESRKKKHKKSKKKKEKKEKKSRKERKSSKKRKRAQSDEENEPASDQLALDLAIEDTEDRPTKRRRLMPMSQDE